MLRTETVEPRTFSILEQLMQIPAIQNFGLVGGTALSLLYGHRMSIDLYLFSNKPFENEEIVTALQDTFSSKFDNRSTNPRFGIFCFIDDVKIDIVRHPHPMIRPTYEIDGIRFFSTEDIMAMKIQAILGRGKKKDFWDIAELLNHFSVQDFIDFHKEKYLTQNILISVPQAMSFFMDADESEDPICLKKQTWQQVQAFIDSKISEYLS